MLKVQPFAQHVYPPLFAISSISVLYYSPCMRRRDCRLVPYHSIESQQNWKITCRRHGLNRESKLQFYLNALVHIFYSFAIFIPLTLQYQLTALLSDSHLYSGHTGKFDGNVYPFPNIQIDP